VLSVVQEFEESIFKDLFEAIIKEFPAPPLPRSSLDLERSYHMHFVEDKSMHFIGRTVSCLLLCLMDTPLRGVFVLPRHAVRHFFLLSACVLWQELMDALHRHCNSGYMAESLPLVVVGAPGSGKTSLVAAFAKQYVLSPLPLTIFACPCLRHARPSFR
jgi:hypothetical protein